MVTAIDNETTKNGGDAKDLERYDAVRRSLFERATICAAHAFGEVAGTIINRGPYVGEVGHTNLLTSTNGQKGEFFFCCQLLNHDKWYYVDFVRTSLYPGLVGPPGGASGASAAQIHKNEVGRPTHQHS